MHDTARGQMHYIAADLDSRTWVEAGFARLQDYLAWWSLVRDLYPGSGRRTWQRPPGDRR
jgi:hypothetical protein